MADITELDELTAEKVSGVGSPANGTPWIVLKAAAGSDDTSQPEGSTEPDEEAEKAEGDLDGDEASAMEDELTKAEGESDEEFEKRKLKAKARNALPDSAFALPGRRFPIHDENHARAALSMLHNASPEEQATIKRKVKARYPDIHQGDDAKKDAEERVEKSPGVPDAATETPTEHGHDSSMARSGVAGPATAGERGTHVDPSVSLGGQSTYEIVAEPKVSDREDVPAKAKLIDVPAQYGQVGKDADWSVLEIVDEVEKAGLTVDSVGLDKPGSPAWEKIDADTLDGAAAGLAAAARAVTHIRQREMIEAVSGDPSDWFDAFQLDCAADHISTALGFVAALAYHEQAAEVQKAGKRLSAKTESALRAARDHLTSLLGEGTPSKEPATESEDMMAQVTKEELVALVNEAATKAALEAVKADREAREEAVKNANNGGDVTAEHMHSQVHGEHDADDVESVGGGETSAVTKSEESEDEAMKAMAQELSELRERMEKMASRPRQGGPVLDGIPHGTGSADAGRMTETVTKSAQDLEIERLEKEMAETLSKSGHDAAARADHLGQMLTLAKLRRFHETSGR